LNFGIGQVSNTVGAVNLDFGQDFKILKPGASLGVRFSLGLDFLMYGFPLFSAQ
jgi:hypothetical protein